MRANWSRARPCIELSNSQLEELIKPVFAGVRVVKAELAQGGLSNTNIIAEISAGKDPVLVRIFERGLESARKEKAISERLHASCPVPEFYYFCEQNPFSGHPYAIVEFMPGRRFETIADSLGLPEQAEVAASLGMVLSRINQECFESAGFLSEKLEVIESLELGSKGLLAYISSCLLEGFGAQRVEPELVEELLSFVAVHSLMLDEAQPRACLTHSDFGGSNILVGREKGVLQVTAVLDWEFAFSGSPYFDLGNLLREPLGSMSHFVECLAEGYGGHGGTLDKNWRQISLLVDLSAWCEFLSRDSAGPELIADANQVIRKTMDSFSAA